jgi:hypothetical protein
MSAFSNTFPDGPTYTGPYAPTGEPFIVLTGGGANSLDDAEAAAHVAFDEYASNHTGKIYWRVLPHTERQSDDKWAFYMRLLISDKAAT